MKNNQDEKRCNYCSGSGKEICKSCQGTGTHININAFYMFGFPIPDVRMCYNCKGTGRSPCIHCNGTGKQKKITY